MSWGDWAAWVQAIGSLIGIGIAIAVPWWIHTREQEATQDARDSYRRLLLDAFTELHKPIAYLAQIKALSSANPLPSVPEETAAQLANAVTTMSDTLSVVSTIEDVNKLDRFEAVLRILALRRQLKEVAPVFEKEHRWLTDHPNSDHVVASAINTLSHHAIELEPAIKSVIKALKVK